MELEVVSHDAYIWNGPRLVMRTPNGNSIGQDDNLYFYSVNPVLEKEFIHGFIVISGRTFDLLKRYVGSIEVIRMMLKMCFITN